VREFSRIPPVKMIIPRVLAIISPVTIIIPRVLARIPPVLIIIPRVLPKIPPMLKRDCPISRNFAFGSPFFVQVFLIFDF
jgi:hypothetical protein